jgi:hypothetical protein
MYRKVFKKEKKKNKTQQQIGIFTELSLNRHEKNKYVSKKTSIPMQKKHTMNL